MDAPSNEIVHGQPLPLAPTLLGRLRQIVKLLCPWGFIRTLDGRTYRDERDAPWSIVEVHVDLGSARHQDGTITRVTFEHVDVAPTFDEAEANAVAGVWTNTIRAAWEASDRLPGDGTLNWNLLRQMNLAEVRLSGGLRVQPAEIFRQPSADSPLFLAAFAGAAGATRAATAQSIVDPVARAYFEAIQHRSVYARRGYGADGHTFAQTEFASLRAEYEAQTIPATAQDAVRIMESTALRVRDRAIESLNHELAWFERTHAAHHRILMAETQDAARRHAAEHSRWRAARDDAYWRELLADESKKTFGNLIDAAADAPRLGPRPSVADYPHEPTAPSLDFQARLQTESNAISLLKGIINSLRSPPFLWATRWAADGGAEWIKDDQGNMVSRPWTTADYEIAIATPPTAASPAGATQGDVHAGGSWCARHKSQPLFVPRTSTAEERRAITDLWDLDDAYAKAHPRVLDASRVADAKRLIAQRSAELTKPHASQARVANDVHGNVPESSSWRKAIHDDEFRREEERRLQDSLAQEEARVVQRATDALERIARDRDAALARVKADAEEKRKALALKRPSASQHAAGPPPTRPRTEDQPHSTRHRSQSPGGRSDNRGPKWASGPQYRDKDRPSSTYSGDAEPQYGGEPRSPSRSPQRRRSPSPPRRSLSPPPWQRSPLRPYPPSHPPRPPHPPPHPPRSTASSARPPEQKRTANRAPFQAPYTNADDWTPSEARPPRTGERQPSKWVRPDPPPFEPPCHPSWRREGPLPIAFQGRTHPQRQNQYGETPNQADSEHDSDADSEWTYDRDGRLMPDDDTERGKAWNRACEAYRRHRDFVDDNTETVGDPTTVEFPDGTRANWRAPHSQTTDRDGDVAMAPADGSGAIDYGDLIGYDSPHEDDDNARHLGSRA